MVCLGLANHPADLSEQSGMDEESMFVRLDYKQPTGSSSTRIFAGTFRKETLKGRAHLIVKPSLRKAELERETS